MPTDVAFLGPRYYFRSFKIQGVEKPGFKTIPQIRVRESFRRAYYHRARRNQSPRRLQIQERMCEQIADAIQSELNPRGIYVRAKAKHLCMVARGIQKQNAVMDSIAVRGEYGVIEKLV